MENIVIREATRQDAKGIATVHVKTWQYAYQGLMPQENLNSLSIEERMQMWSEILKTKPPKTQQFVAEFNGSIVGFCAVGTSRDKDANERTGEVYSIYIDSQLMRKGIGTKLLKKGLGELKSFAFSQATLWVLDTNRSGRNFYEKHGWKTDGETKTEKRNNFDLRELRYYKDLNDM
ncbi:MAG: GNAT family N-acetyltransferase [Candidatus Levybacteria bacterium]|nr:GNAT family N-acetyltransferase [Candidatus Levybacteria bacterium]